MSNNRLSYEEEHSEDGKFIPVDVKQFLPKSNYDKVMKQIEDIYCKKCDEFAECAEKKLPVCAWAINNAYQILSIPNLLIKADNQELPELFYKEPTPINSDFARENNIARKAQQDMKNDGFVKVEKR